MTLGTYPALSLAEARDAWREARRDTAAGRDPAQARKRDKPANDFETVAREWLRRDQSKNKSQDEVKRVLERELIPAWGYRVVADLGRRDILDLLDAIADRGAPTMARRVQAYIHRFFKWAVGRGIVELNPAADLPKPAPAVELLDQTLRIRTCDFVFSTNGKTPISGWSRAKAKLDSLATIAPWRLHDLRRTVATGLQRLGISLQVVEAVLGHVSGSRAGVVGIYQRHSYSEEKRTALEAWSVHVTALVAQGPLVLSPKLELR